MSRHNNHLSSYIKSRKEKSSAANAGEAVARSDTKKPSKVNTKTRRQKHLAPSPSSLLFPDEIVCKIFSFLSPSQILICAQVCKNWHAVSNEMNLWVHHYNLIPRSVRDAILPKERATSTFQWKNEIIKRTVIQRDKKLKVMLKKLNPYTGLSAGTVQALKFLSIKWQLSLTGHDDQQYNFINDDMFCFASSITARWYSCQLPPIPKLKSFAVTALTPVFYHRDWKAHHDSSTRKSLLMKFEFKDLKLTKEKCISQDEMITVHTVHPGVMLAVWRSSWEVGGEVAFLTVCFHHHRLIERIILGERERVHEPLAHQSVFDDIDPSYGLHRYSATVELRNQRKLFWGNQYRELFCKSFTNDYLVLQSHQEQEGMFNVKTSLKTPVFKTTLNDMVILDLTLLDEHKEPMWCISFPVKVVQDDKDEVNYTYSDGIRSVVEYEDDVGKLRMELIWIEEDEQNLVKVIELHLRKAIINDWFGTKY